MRIVYRKIGGDESSYAFSLTEQDLVGILAEHFGFDPDSVDLKGLTLQDGEFYLSGSTSHLRRNPGP